MDLVYIWYGKVFEWDTRKSARNKLKHGISFEKAMTAWSLDYVTVRTFGSVVDEERRYIVVTKIEEKFYTIIWTHRGDRVRIISARRSRNVEKKVFTSYFSNS